jgi:cysteine synthase
MNSILSFIGNTPMIKIKNNLFVKMEKFNPSGSVKDRPVSYMIKNAIQSGKLSKDKIILDATSGNTGISIAMISATLGYESVLVMPESMSLERRKIIKAYGAKIILVSGDMDNAIEKAKELSEDERYFYLDQFSNEYNVQSHYETTGKEIWEQTSGRITHLVVGIGSGGTITGVAKFLKEKNSKIKIIGVEPRGKIQGLKDLSKNKKPKILDLFSVDGVVLVTDKQAKCKIKELASMGLFVGQSSGAAYYAAEKISGGLVVVVFPDGGEKYLSTEMFNSSD